MESQNRVFHSTDPLGQENDPEAQANEKLESHVPPARPEIPEWNVDDEEMLDPTSPLEIRELRKHMRLTQREFAGWFGFSVATLRHWERGNRTPTGTAKVLLHVIHDNPHAVLKAVRKARRKHRESLAAIEPLKSFRASPGRRVKVW